MVDVILIALARQLLKEIPPHVFIGVYTVLVLTACMLISLIVVRWSSINLKTIVREQPARSLSLPVLFFAGSVAEFYAQASVSIYTLIAIGAITFIMDVISDVRQKRIHINLQTCSFIFLVAAGVGLAAIGA